MRLSGPSWSLCLSDPGHGTLKDRSAKMRNTNQTLKMLLTIKPVLMPAKLVMMAAIEEVIVVNMK
jgi:hypothetical protein